ncbi:MAG: hypothetical protein V4760_00345 [Bdellovibrionota bacterium]
MNRTLAFLSLLVVSNQAFAASPMASCVVSDMAKIKTLIEQDSTVGPFGVSLAASSAYQGLNQAQLVANAGAAGVRLRVNEIEAKLKSAVNEFMASKADPSQTALVALGDASRRQIFQILRRPKGQPAVAANAESKCNSGSCEDMAVKTELMYVLKGSTVAKAVDTLGVYKLETTGNVDVHFCQASASCNQRAHLMAAGGEVQKSKTPAPMKPNTSYVLRESGMGVETTSVYKIHPATICGKPAALLTGVMVRGENAFDSSSTIALAVESDDRVILLAHYQGYVAGGRGNVPKWMLDGGIVGAVAKGSLNGIYNRQAERLGSPERVNGKGMLK